MPNVEILVKMTFVAIMLYVQQLIMQLFVNVPKIHEVIRIKDVRKSNVKTRMIVRQQKRVSMQNVLNHVVCRTFVEKMRDVQRKIILLSVHVPQVRPEIHNLAVYRYNTVAAINNVRVAVNATLAFVP